ncbi:hypothetical protein [Blastococcus sp. SYSU DS0539]
MAAPTCACRSLELETLTPPATATAAVAREIVRGVVGEYRCDVLADAVLGALCTETVDGVSHPLQSAAIYRGLGHLDCLPVDSGPLLPKLGEFGEVENAVLETGERAVLDVWRRLGITVSLDPSGSGYLRVGGLDR